MVARQRCLCCGAVFDAGAAGSCPRCGAGGADIELFSLQPLRVELRMETGSGDRCSFHGSDVFGRELARLLCREAGSQDFKFVSKEQFRIERTDDGWFVSGVPTATNHTYLNGSSISGVRVELHEGDRLFMGNGSTGNGMTVVVAMVLRD